MALFQQSVLKKHIESLNTSIIDEKWKLFQSHFQNTIIQQNIRQLKEEQYQGEFLEDLFVKIFGYIKAPSPNFNIITEQKNITNSKKADGAIIVNEKALAVIELKGTDTTDLAKIESQAFGYKSNQPGCNYVITSNFEKLRFYIDNTTQFEEFNLFTLDKPSFELLYCCLDWESISKNTPVNLLNQSVSKENAITKHLYRDYSEFKRNLFDNLVELNPQFDKLELFKKTQKLLDRFLFIFFAEDRLLLPTNLIRRINQEWEELQNMRIPVSLYDRYKIYFNDLNEGARVTLPAFGNKTGEAIKETHDIFAYNGGLFKPDNFLDNLKIDDQLLYNYTLKLSDYDFQSEVDVNILGHIFENSLNEIDEIKSEIEGKEVDKTKTKRKKDGVFYTPKYITKYIVDNTVGKLCTEKKAEIKLIEEEYHTDKNLQTKTKKALLDKLIDYREWLLQLTICDPACGSGAFLNQALEFLIAEHRYIDELQAKLMGDSMVLSDVETSILENNIYGVDLNDESIEIAKLSLWLRTAQKGRKLNSLNNNIKCGNSLIENPEVAGDKAFSWEKEFPDVFAKGGFDVIIGNPPYVDIKALDNILVQELFKKYKTAENRINLYSIFIERGYHITKDKGILSFINPNSILINSSYTKIRKMLVQDMSKIIKLPDGVFEDATVETIIFEFQKNTKKQNIESIVYSKNERISSIENSRIQIINKDNWVKNDDCNYNIFISKNQQNILNKIENKSKKLFEIVDFCLGITPYDKYKGHSEQTIKNREYHSPIKLNENYKPLITGENITRYTVSNQIKEYINYGEWLGAPRNEKFFKEERILIRQIVSGNPPRIYAGYTDEELYFTQIGFGIISIDNHIHIKYLLCLLNSNLINFYHKYRFLDLEKELFQKILIANCKNFPIKSIKSISQQPFIDKADLILSISKDFLQIIQKFTSYFSSKYNIEKLPGKLEKWYELTFVDFIKELNKAIKAVKGTPLTKKDEFEWMDLFEENKKKALELKAEIDKTDKEIDQMVYALYGLTEEEIKIVEGE
jgi:type I restriction-modification system DNA methylase subunit